MVVYTAPKRQWRAARNDASSGRSSPDRSPAIAPTAALCRAVRKCRPRGGWWTRRRPSIGIAVAPVTIPCRSRHATSLHHHGTCSPDVNWGPVSPRPSIHSVWVVGSFGDGMSYGAFLWRDGVMSNLGGFPGTDQNEATAINDRGQVVGWSGVFEGRAARSCGKRANSPILAGSRDPEKRSLPGSTRAGTPSGGKLCLPLPARSAHRPVYGFLYRYRDGLVHAHRDAQRRKQLGERHQRCGSGCWCGRDRLWRVPRVRLSRRRTHRSRHPAGRLGSDALAIIDSETSSAGRAGSKRMRSDRPFLYRDGQMIDLGSLPGLSGGEARDINDAGLVVGFSGEADASARVPVRRRDQAS